MLPICVCKERKRRKDDFDIATGMNHGVASFSIGVSVCGILKWALQKLEAPDDSCTRIDMLGGTYLP
jgi:hypothetical protein